jgi:hypothetical protein
MSDHHKEPLDKGSAMMQKLLLGAITSLISISLTFAVTEHSLCASVRDDNIQAKAEIKNIKERHEHLTSLLETVVKQNTELITLIKVQQQVKGP